MAKKQTKAKPKEPKANRLPAFVQIGSHRIPVRREEIDAEEEAQGYFAVTEKGPLIVVDSRLSGVNELETFFHELLHAIDRHAGGSDLPHRQVYSLASGLTQSLSKYLTFIAK